LGHAHERRDVHQTLSELRPRHHQQQPNMLVALRLHASRRGDRLGSMAPQRLKRSWQYYALLLLCLLMALSMLFGVGVVVT
jgi:hypothetical protein